MNLTRKRVLFVDDDSSVLDVLASLLRPERDRWDMVFVVGSEAALDALQRGPFDALVTDMQMPGIDGASLLSRVKQQSPGTVRIMLTGSEVDARTTDADAILAKPCSGKILRALLERLMY